MNELESINDQADKLLEDRLETYWELMKGDLESWHPAVALIFIERLHELQKDWLKEKLGL